MRSAPANGDAPLTIILHFFIVYSTWILLYDDFLCTFTNGFNTETTYTLFRIRAQTNRALNHEGLLTRGGKYDENRYRQAFRRTEDIWIAWGYSRCVPQGNILRNFFPGLIRGKANPRLICCVYILIPMRGQAHWGIGPISRIISQPAAPPL